MSEGPGAESFALVWQGNPVGPDVKWRPCSLSFSPPVIPTPAPFFISVTLLPRLCCLLRNEHPCVKISYQNLTLTPNTWLSLTKEGVPTQNPPISIYTCSPAAAIHAIALVVSLSRKPFASAASVLTMPPLRHAQVNFPSTSLSGL